MKEFGLIGFPLGHSFSQKYFTEKFEAENISDCSYNNYEIENANDLLTIIKENGKSLKGLNVTIPHKQNVIPLLDELDPKAEKIGAVNVIKPLPNGKLKGYNSDYYGFQNSLLEFLNGYTPKKALILGTGGASKAVKVALEDLGIIPTYVSRKSGQNQYSYADLNASILSEHELIINCTPLGTFPNVSEKPSIDYTCLTSSHYLYDLVYNPTETAFMKAGLEQGSKAKNGFDMLKLQAEKAWEIWNA